MRRWKAQSSWFSTGRRAGCSGDSAAWFLPYRVRRVPLIGGVLIGVAVSEGRRTWRQGHDIEKVQAGGGGR